jgi:hypothetical protein
MATWMQTTGAALLVVELRSLAHVLMPAQMAVARMGCCTSLLYRTTVTI